MPRLTWSQSAREDLKRLHEFLDKKDSNAARRAIAAIYAGMALLRKSPQIGRPVEGMLPGFRERVIEQGQGGYVALYHFDGKQVVVLAVRHGREADYASL